MESFFTEQLISQGYRFVTGVPDSGLKAWLSTLNRQSVLRHVTATQEGSALALAMGSYLATKKPAIVYLQNSGFGNLLNPLTSLMSSDAFGIPALLVVGWRGSPFKHDEPQHRTMGRAQLEVCRNLGVPTFVLENSPPSLTQGLHLAKQHFERESTPFALIVPPGILDTASAKQSESVTSITCGFESKVILKMLRKLCPAQTRFIGTTGYTARDLNQLAEEEDSHGARDFLCVGGMGHALMLGLGMSLEKPDSHTCVIDGDGAALMHMGSWAMVSAQKPARLVHVLFNNGCHESTGAQDLAHSGLEFSKIASAMGYATSTRVIEIQEFEKTVIKCLNSPGPHFIEVPTVRRTQDGPAARPKFGLSVYRDRFASGWETHD